MPQAFRRIRVSSKKVLCIALALHFSLLLCVCGRETLWLVHHGLTTLPTAVRSTAEVGENLAAGALGRKLPRTAFARRALNTYLYLAGIQSGYGFFAPNVPDSYQLVFELHYRDGRIDYESAALAPGESTLRFASLMDFIGRTASDPEREALVKLLATAAWRQHPDVIEMRALLGSLAFPPPREFRQGAPARYDFRVAYDFVPAAEQ